MLVTGSDDTTAKLLDFKTGKVIQAVPSADKSNYTVVNFLIFPSF